MIPVSQSLAWNHEMGGRRSCNRWVKSGSAGASAKPMYRKKEGRGEEEGGKWGERGQVKEAV
jgi:hypothetical protein